MSTRGDVFINKPDTFIWYREHRNYAARNIYEVINNWVVKAAKDEDVIALLDGDDELKGTHALEPIRAAYANKNIWLTYGSYEKMSGDKTTFNGRYKPSADVRRVRWHATHLKTFRYGLWRHLPEQAMKGSDGTWLTTCSDVAVMLPLLEMAGLNRTRFVEQIVYRYNDLIGGHDHKDKSGLQIETDKWIRTQPSFKRLETL
jgi:hypothetical protein